MGDASLALVTGASSGIGREVARLLARRGFRLIVVARRRSRLDALAAECSAATSYAVVPVDLGDPAAIEPALRPVLAAHGVPDVLVNNAGYGLYRPFLEHTAADHQRLMQVNYFAPLTLTQLVLPGMRARGRGHVINVASMSAKIAPWGHAGYAAAKAALVALTQVLAAEHRASGVRFGYVVPGIVRTEYFDAPSLAPLSRQVARHAISAETVARRIVGLLDRPRLEVCVPRYYRALDCLKALSPGLAHAVVAHASRPAVRRTRR